VPLTFLIKIEVVLGAPSILDHAPSKVVFATVVTVQVGADENDPLTKFTTYAPVLDLVTELIQILLWLKIVHGDVVHDNAVVAPPKYALSIRSAPFELLVTEPTRGTLIS
jgi:hypothetical protein